jgi:hypothetical protein
MNGNEDYTAALAVALRTKTWLLILILLILFGELGMFFLYRYEAAWKPKGVDLLQYCIGLIEFFGVTLAILLMVDLLLALNIVLAGGLSGAAGLVRAFIWSAVLLLLLFPWQAFLANATFTSDAFKIPGVLYTWDELTARARWNAASMDFWEVFLRWARFVAFPIFAVIVLLAVNYHAASRKIAAGDKVGA